MKRLCPIQNWISNYEIRSRDFSGEDFRLASADAGAFFVSVPAEMKGHGFVLTGNALMKSVKNEPLILLKSASLFNL